MPQEQTFDLKSLISEDDSVESRIRVKLVSEPFNCKKTAFPIFMIRRQIRAGKGAFITKADIIRWGKRHSSNKKKV